MDLTPDGADDDLEPTRREMLTAEVAAVKRAIARQQRAQEAKAWARFLRSRQPPPPPDDLALLRTWMD